ncbi:AAA family ATPase [Marivirga sp. S37H4]|uniref:AAA family ATPase n=1 Tax=Marivirga aurantiaca TaxID=2802615 RepID=A0A935C594_9BACT|nr:AAA family ATPase [Marivirga aurantiaca]MBK6263680.1 AAA family ATPase [Marivirga aurantiaca]
MPKASDIIRSKFPFEPTPGQVRFFNALDVFFELKDDDRPMMLLKGYAGTGKTTIVSALVQFLPLFNYKYVLIAPTGRAAKVMSNYAKRIALTIHKKIYKQLAEPGSGEPSFSLQKNYHYKTLFIIDEASMLSDDVGFGSSSLLNDLVTYIFQNEGNKILFIGDDAQLPPVGKTTSPGLDVQYLTHTFRSKVIETVLTEVMRQAQDSGILYNATLLRAELPKKELNIKFQTKSFKDIFRMTGERLEDGLRYAYDKYGIDNTTIICRSNKAAVQYNEYIRRQIHFMDSELEVADFLMIVRNNYVYQSEDTPGGFLANGDFMEVVKVINFEEMYGFRFADLEIRLTDYNDLPNLQVKIMMDTLHSPTPSLNTEDYRKLYQAVSEDYMDLATKTERREAMKKDPYLNALQVKFAYALTCHKSQGGQWKAVFVDQGYLTDEMLDKEYVRWLYTAVTRATDELFLVNFNNRFF